MKSLVVLLFMSVLFSSCAISQKSKSHLYTPQKKFDITYRFLQIQDFGFDKKKNEAQMLYKNVHDPSLYNLPQKFQEALNRNSYISKAKFVKLKNEKLLVIKDLKNPPTIPLDEFKEGDSEYYVDFIFIGRPSLLNPEFQNAWGFTKVMASLLTLTLIPYTEKLRMDLVAVIYDKNLKPVVGYKATTKSSYHIWLPYIFFADSKTVFSFDLKAPLIDKSLDQLFQVVGDKLK